MPLYPNPAGGSMEVANQAEAEAAGWTPSMGTFGAYSEDSNFQPQGPSSTPPPPSPTMPGTTVAAAPRTGTTTPTTTGAGADQYGAAIQKLLEDLARGDMAALEEQIRQFDLKYGLDRDAFVEGIRQYNQNYLISQAGLTGTFGGAPTMQMRAQLAQLYGTEQPAPGQLTLQAQNEAANFLGTYQGQPTLQAQNQAYTQQFNLMQAAQQAQANPFRQAQLYGQAQRLMAGQPVPGFQAPGVVAGVGTVGGNMQGGLGYLQQILDDIKNPTPNQTQADAFLAQTPTPNKIDSASFLRSTPSTQNIILQAMQEKYGIDPKDAVTQIQNTLPQTPFASPAGTVRR
jgi:hypothetical protein